MSPTGTKAGLYWEIVAYGAASAIALAADAAMLLALTSGAGWHYLPASVVSFMSGGVVAYALSVQIVFRFRRIQSRPLEFGCFLGLGTAGLVVNSAAMLVAVGSFGLKLLTAKGLAAGCTFATNFTLRRQLLFRPGSPA